MVIGTGKELISFAERNGVIISQHIWEALTDLDKCDPKSSELAATDSQQPQVDITADDELNDSIHCRP